MEANVILFGGRKMEWLGSAVDIIILIGALFLAFERIIKPFGIFKKKSDQAFEQKVVEILVKVLPQMLREHDLQTRDKYKADREKYLQDIKKEVLSSIQNELGQVSNLQEQYEALVISAKDVLREKIMAIYHKNKSNKSLAIHEREALDQYYKDYKAMHGNSYIDKYYARMKNWKEDEDDYIDDDN